MLRILATATLLALGLAGPASAQDYPSKPIRLIVGFAPGAGTDATARIAAEFLSQRLGQSVVVENKGGGGTAIAADFIAKSKNDGYTLYWATNDSFSILPAVKKELSYKPLDDFAFVAITSRFAPMVVVNASRPYKTIQEVVAFGKANPGKLRYSSAGVGTAPHLAMAVVAKVTGVDMVHVPYPGSAPALTGAVGGHVDMAAAAPASVKPHIDSGALRAVASVDSERHFQFPDVPTLKESGLAATIILYNSVVAPAGTPEPILARLRKELKAMIDDPKVSERVRALGYQPTYVEGAAFRETMAKDLAIYSDVAKSFGISVD
jgi:tripartite-type tricarboxylate transporter receptor subunit TctC